MKEKKKILWITQTAAMLAMLIAVQALTASAGQLVTGSAVNAILAASALLCGMGSGLCVALLSPFFAFLLGIGPGFFPLVPIIAAANAVYVALIRLMAGGTSAPLWRLVPGVVCGAAAKFGVLYLCVVELVCRFAALAPKQLETFSTMFSFPQLFTALIGGAAALLICLPLGKALANLR